MTRNRGSQNEDLATRQRSLHAPESGGYRKRDSYRGVGRSLWVVMYQLPTAKARAGCVRLHLLVAQMGLYAVLAFTVSQRTREIAIRMAPQPGRDRRQSPG